MADKVCPVRDDGQEDAIPGVKGPPRFFDRFGGSGIGGG